MDKTEFLNRVQALVNFREANHTYAQALLDFDPEIRPTLTAYLQGLDQLVSELLKRGIEKNQTVMVGSTLRGEMARRWAREFSQQDYASNLPYAEKYDRALVPFIQVHEAALNDLRQYCKQRIEFQ
jgi:hypothetical protein